MMILNSSTSIKAVIDSSVLVGLLNPFDHWHTHSIALHNNLITANFEAVYFDCVIAEIVTTVNRRLFEKSRFLEIEQFFTRLDSLAPERKITWVLSHVQDHYADILRLIRSTSGELNFHDALIAIICREQQISTIISYDSDFDQIPWLKRISKPDDLPR